MPRTRNKSLQSSEIGVYSVPFVGINSVRSIGGQRALLVAVLDVWDGYLCIEYQLGLSQVVLCAVKKGQFPHFFQRTQDELSDVVADLKSKAIEHGATLEAIQLLGAITPITTAEEAEMAKSPAAKAADKTKLAKTKAAPAAKGGGNAEALAKARAARSSANDAKKIKVIKKDHGAREGSKRANMLDIVLASKTVAEAKEKGAGWIDVKFAEDQGLISLS